MTGVPASQVLPSARRCLHLRSSGISLKSYEHKTVRSTKKKFIGGYSSLAFNASTSMEFIFNKKKKTKYGLYSYLFYKPTLEPKAHVMQRQICPIRHERASSRE